MRTSTNTSAGSPSRIVFINRYFFPDHSATSQMLTDLACDLAKTSTDVYVIASRLMYDGQERRLPASESVGGVSVVRVWSTSFGRSHLAGRAIDYFTFYLTSTVALWRLLHRDSVVIVKTDPPLLSVLATPVARLRGAAVVNWIQDLFPEVAIALNVRLLSGTLQRVLVKVRNATLRHARFNVAIGFKMAQVIQNEVGSETALVTIPNWADGDQITPLATELNSLRESWDLKDKFVVGYSGNLGRAHEFDTILQAAQRLADRRDIVFLFIGGGAQRQSVEKEASRRGLTRVFFKPYQPREKLTESLGVADIHLITLNPALEGLIVPSKLYGVLAAGKPTLFVGDPDGEVARVLSSAQCGRSVPTGDAIRLAEEIATLSRRPEIIRCMGENARLAFDQLFSRKAAVTSWKAQLSLDQ